MENQNPVETKAYKYFLMGLNSKEIAKLLDISFRTVQGYMSRGKWKEQRKADNLKHEVLKLYESGETYNEIAEKLKISRTSVYNKLKQSRLFKENQKR